MRKRSLSSIQLLLRTPRRVYRNQILCFRNQVRPDHFLPWDFQVSASIAQPWFSLTSLGMPPPPFGAPPGQPGMMPPGGRGMPFPPFNPQGGPPPNLPQGLPFPPQGFPPNFQPQFPPGGFNPGQPGGPQGLPAPPGSVPGHPGQSQSPAGGYNAGPPPGVGMNRR